MDIHFIGSAISATSKADRDIDLALHNLGRRPETGEFLYRFASNAAFVGNKNIIVYEQPSFLDEQTFLFIQERDEKSVVVCPRYTDSIDAAISLGKRLKPDLCASLQFDARPRAYMYEKDGFTIGAKLQRWVAYADAETMPLAICSAVVNAMIGYRT